MANQNGKNERDLLIAGLIMVGLGVFQILAFPPLALAVGFVRSLAPMVAGILLLVLGWKRMWFMIVPGCFLIGTVLGLLFGYPYGGVFLGEGVGLILIAFPRSN